MPVYAFEGKRPVIAGSTYVAPTAVVIGSVTLGESCYVGHAAILRADYGSIVIGDETAVEEGAIVHARPNEKTSIGSRVTIGHGATIHNAMIRHGAVIGMRAVICDYAIVGKGSIIGEMGLVKRGQEIPPFKVAVGSPVRVIGDVEGRHNLMSHRAKDIYVELAERYSGGGLVELEPHSRNETAIGEMIPIGTIHTPFKEAVGAPIQGGLSPEEEGEVLVAPCFQEGLSDLNGFSHVILIYSFHRAKGFELRVKPYLDDSKRGVFATRSPRRPNAIGVTVVRLLGIEGRRLRIRGVDMLDGTPLLDIKPSVPLFDSYEAGRYGWLEPHLEKLRRGEVRPRADNRFHCQEQQE